MEIGNDSLRISEWIMWATPFAILGLGWVMKVRTERIVGLEIDRVDVRRDEQRKSDKNQIFDKINLIDKKQQEHDANIKVLLERSSVQAESTKRIDGHIKELSGKMDDLKDLLIQNLSSSKSNN